jgi:DNA-directed RNA polymerase specialized sigma subunit
MTINKHGKKVEMYVKNEDMLKALIQYRQDKEDDPDTKIPEYLGACFIKIANRLATKGNFYGYTYKDEMIADGILDCVKAVKNFDPEKSGNPFGYFTQIIYYAFIRRINVEKKKYHTVLDYIHEMDTDMAGEDDESRAIIESLKRDVEEYQGAHND